MPSPRTRGSTQSSSVHCLAEAAFPAHAGIDPNRPQSKEGEESLPRARGDRPWAPLNAMANIMPSPRTRGSTFSRQRSTAPASAFPAHAGIDLFTISSLSFRSSLPRARGDRPWSPLNAMANIMPSPRTRGSTLMRCARTTAAIAFPAHAGIDPMSCAATSTGCGLPRARGDRPGQLVYVLDATGPSPRTRGSTQGDRAAQCHATAFPAHAGIDLNRLTIAYRFRSLPRARGDRPDPQRRYQRRSKPSPRTRGSTLASALTSWAGRAFPAHAGIDPLHTQGTIDAIRLPRARGDRPFPLRQVAFVSAPSPRTRGSTANLNEALETMNAFPAHAGIDLRLRSVAPAPSSLPRARGDRPLKAVVNALNDRPSPRTRGSTCVVDRQQGATEAFPAHAGIDPGDRALAKRCTRLPRARGDRPADFFGNYRAIEPSPRTRGSTLSMVILFYTMRAFPAHAGIDPHRAQATIDGNCLPRARGDRP